MKNRLLVTNYPISLIRAAAFTVFIGGLAFAGSVNAASTDMSNPPESATDQASAPPKQDHKMDHSAQAMAQHVEARIKTLHDKLSITGPQETKWEVVAQTMRDNETNISQLIEARHKNVQGMTAIDDLQSYESITQAHVDGLKNLIPAFQSLYGDMSDDQKEKADKVFGSFEGHRADKSAKKS
jgi:hypothetical protein